MYCFHTFVHFNMIITVALANTSITSFTCQHGSTATRKVRCGQWSRNGSVKGWIAKVALLALQATCSVKSCSTETATIDNMQRNGQDPVMIKFYKIMRGIRFDLITKVCQPLVQRIMQTPQCFPMRFSFDLHSACKCITSYPGRQQTLALRTPSLPCSFRKRVLLQKITCREHRWSMIIAAMHEGITPGAWCPLKMCQDLPLHWKQWRTPQTVSMCWQSHFTIC